MEPRSGESAPSRIIPPRRISRSVSLIGIVLALSLLAGLGWLAWSLTRGEGGAAGGGRSGARGQPATTVGLATAERADIPVLVEALGTVTPVATVIVRPQVSGVLQRVIFREGQVVRQGDLLALIDSRPFEMALMQATGQRQRDEAQLENARLTLQRYRTLQQQDSIARQEVDTQAALVKQLEAAVTIARAAEGVARLELGHTRIGAPISGRLGLRAVDVGNVVSPGDAGGLVVITQLDPIDVEFALPQDLVAEVLAQGKADAAMPVTALDRTRTTVLATGTFSTLDNVVDTQTGTVRAKARFANSTARLFPNQFVNVRLQLRTLEGAVVVPVHALRRGSQGDFVYVLNEADRTVSLRAVKRGISTAEKTVIDSGLQPGEKVITEGADRLRDGSRVVLPGERPKGGARGEAESSRTGPAGRQEDAPRTARPASAASSS